MIHRIFQTLIVNVCLYDLMVVDVSHASEAKLMETKE
jgi:hypothetical protein